MVCIDMEMPKNCLSCPLHVGSVDIKGCAITNEWNACSGINRGYKCPLIETDGKPLTAEEVAFDLGCKSIETTEYWFEIASTLQKCGYVICKVGSNYVS